MTERRSFMPGSWKQRLALFLKVNGRLALFYIPIAVGQISHVLPTWLLVFITTKYLVVIIRLCLILLCNFLFSFFLNYYRIVQNIGEYQLGILIVAAALHATARKRRRSTTWQDYTLASFANKVLRMYQTQSIAFLSRGGMNPPQLRFGDSSTYSSNFTSFVFSLSH